MAVDFHLELNPTGFHHKIKYGDQILLIGSCFTSHLYERFHAHKFIAFQNSHGILFNPISILNALNDCIDLKLVNEDELFMHQSLWHHWDFHSHFSHEHKAMAIAGMNQQIKDAHKFLKHANWLFITLGSAFVYDHQEKGIVANCHKIQADQFNRYLLDPNELKDRYNQFLLRLKEFNPDINVVFTVSPVRHLRDGLIENNRSKAVLLHAIDLICKVNPTVFYFPSYELIIDDLRDYRFYAEDMVHPNYLATQYVWDKFVSSCIEGKTQEAMKEVNQLLQAVKHRPLHPQSQDHLKFRQKFHLIAKELAKRFPSLDFSAEIEYFS